MEDNWTPNTKSKPKDFLRKQGFYVVLFLCLLIVGTAIVLTSLPQEEEAPPAAEESAGQNSVFEVRQSDDEVLAAKATPLPTATPSPLPSGSPSAKPAATPAQPAGTVKKGIAPVSGEIVWSFADEQLLYSRTLDQWTTHAGVDIAAEKGTEVKAVLAGTVEEVYEDDALGWTVTVVHTNDRMSLYANLDPAIAVKPGQKLNAGDALGKIGDSATAECGEVSHLHLGFFIEDKAVDPAAYVVIAH